MNHIVLDPLTELRIAVIGWKGCANDKLAEASERLMRAGAAYLAAAKSGAQPKRPYTEQLAWAAQNCSCSRPHERAMAIEPLTEIENLAREEQRAEADALKRAKLGAGEPKPLDPNRHDVRLGLIGAGEE